MSCSRLASLVSRLEKSNYDIVELISVLLVIQKLEPVGRTIISRVLGIGDKKARNLVAYLASNNLLQTTRGGSVLSDDARLFLKEVLCAGNNKYTVALVPCSISKLSITELRDEIVLLLKRPMILKAIGYACCGKVSFPGMPVEYAKLFAEIVRNVVGNHIDSEKAIAVFEAENCYACCASFLQALVNSSKRSETISLTR